MTEWISLDAGSDAGLDSGLELDLPGAGPVDINAGEVAGWLEQNRSTLNEDELAVLSSPAHRSAKIDLATLGIGLARRGKRKPAHTLAIAILRDAETDNDAIEDIPTEELAVIGLFLSGHREVQEAVQLRDRLLQTFQTARTPYPRTPQSYVFALQLLCCHRDAIGNDLIAFASMYALGHAFGERLPHEVTGKTGPRAAAFREVIKEGNGLFAEIEMY